MIAKKLLLSLSSSATLFLLFGCNQQINRDIMKCDSGDANACKALINHKWAHSQIKNRNSKKILEQKILEDKYAEDIDATNECIAGKNYACANVNLANLEKVYPASVSSIKQRIAEIKEAKEEAERVAKEKATWGNWQYSSTEDMATGKTSYSATLDSENTLNFGFPYAGTQNGRLTLRRHPRYGFDAIISIQQGQILCSEYSNPHILIRFDNSSPSRYECAEPADNSSTYTFIRGADRFVRGMESASIAYVTLTFYQEGSQTLKFKVKGYDQSRL